LKDFPPINDGQKLANTVIFVGAEMKAKGELEV